MNIGAWIANWLISFFELSTEMEKGIAGLFGIFVMFVMVVIVALIILLAMYKLGLVKD